METVAVGVEDTIARHGLIIASQAFGKIRDTVASARRSRIRDQDAQDRAAHRKAMEKLTLEGMREAIDMLRLSRTLFENDQSVSGSICLDAAIKSIKGLASMVEILQRKTDP